MRCAQMLFLLISCDTFHLQGHCSFSIISPIFASPHSLLLPPPVCLLRLHKISPKSVLIYAKSQKRRHLSISSTIAFIDRGHHNLLSNKHHITSQHKQLYTPTHPIPSHPYPQKSPHQLKIKQSFVNARGYM